MVKRKRKNSDYIKCWQVCREIESYQIAGGNIKGYSRKQCGSFLKKLNMQLQYDPIIACSGINSKEMKT